MLVFFESTAKLNKYYKSSASNQYKNNMMVVTEEVTAANKDNIIRQATSPGSVILLSREFGRGTDFIIYDDRVNESGGVQVIQTFLSEELSEETQIKGRAARQGCKGSYCMILSELDLEKFGINSKGPDSIHHMKSTNNYYEILNKKRCAFFKTMYESSLEYVDLIAEDHGKAITFLKNLVFIPPASVEEGTMGIRVEVVEDMTAFLNDRNKSYFIEAPITSRTLILMDATASMSRALNKTKNTVKTMIAEATAVLENNSQCPGGFEIQIAVYRNYNAPMDLILEHSGWESNPDNLFQFMDTIKAQYGWKNEAIEVGLWHANNELLSNTEGQMFQVILIGDMPPNSRSDIVFKHQDPDHLDCGWGGEEYWRNSPLDADLYYETELQKLKLAGVPVHSFYVKETARLAFKKISRHAGPDSMSQFLDIDSSAGADMLTGLVTERILNDVGGRGDQGMALIDEYRQRFPKGYTKSNAAAASE